jgi:hypothetical protein
MRIMLETFRVEVEQATAQFAEVVNMPVGE